VPLARTPVSSSFVAEIGYDPETMTLEVLLTRGLAYQYLGVPDAEYQNLMNAASIGIYLNQRIKGRYRCLKL
jgi:hypothetical protein